MEKLVAETLGVDGIQRLVSAFYRRVRFDELIAPMYPSRDWDGAEQRLCQFLLFRFGLDDRYITERGHPRLRMRHLPFSIGEPERDRWLALMGQAMDEIGLEGLPRESLDEFFQQVADFMRNRD